MPWSYRGLGVESEWRKSDFKKKRRKRAAGGGARRRGADVGEVADASFLSENIYECSDDESAMAKKADGLHFEHVADRA